MRSQTHSLRGFDKAVMLFGPDEGDPSPEQIAQMCEYVRKNYWREDYRKNKELKICRENRNAAERCCKKR